MNTIPPFEFILTSVDWSVFTTLTFRSVAGASERRVLGNGGRWLREIANLDQTAWTRFLWALRYEEGEVNGRPHLHALIVVKPDTLRRYIVTPAGTVPVAHRKWGLGLTTSRRVSNGSDPAVGYILKGLDGGSIYELSKTARAQHLILSGALVQMLTRRRQAAGSDKASETHWQQVNTGWFTGAEQSTLADASAAEFPAVGGCESESVTLGRG